MNSIKSIVGKCQEKDGIIVCEVKDDGRSNEIPCPAKDMIGSDLVSGDYCEIYISDSKFFFFKIEKNEYFVTNVVSKIYSNLFRVFKKLK